jgi:hypothetical protein
VKSEKRKAKSEKRKAKSEKRKAKSEKNACAFAFQTLSEKIAQNAWKTNVVLLFAFRY